MSNIELFNKSGLIIALTLFLLPPSLSYSAPRPVDITVINQSSLSRSDLRAAINFTRNLLPVATRWSYRHSPLKCRIRNWPYTYLLANLCYFRERLYDPQKGLIVYVSDPFYLKHRVAIGGFSSGCDPNSYSVVFMGKDSRYLNRLPELLAHEVAHSLCAEHDDTSPPTLMNQAVLAYNATSFSKKSLIEIKKGWSK